MLNMSSKLNLVVKSAGVGAVVGAMPTVLYFIWRVLGYEIGDAYMNIWLIIFGIAGFLSGSIITAFVINNRSKGASHKKLVITVLMLIVIGAIWYYFADYRRYQM